MRWPRDCARQLMPRLPWRGNTADSIWLRHVMRKLRRQWARQDAMWSLRRHRQISGFTLYPMNLIRFLFCVALLGGAPTLQASPAGDTAKAVGRLLRDVENIEGPTLARGAAMSSKTYNRMNEEQKSSGMGTFILLLLFGFLGLGVVKVVLLLSRPKALPTPVQRAAPAATAPRPPVAYSSIAQSAPPSIPPPIPQPAHTPPPIPRSTHTPPPLPPAQY
jgi:hypothetical protein